MCFPSVESNRHALILFTITCLGISIFLKKIMQNVFGQLGSGEEGVHVKESLVPGRLFTKNSFVVNHDLVYSDMHITQSESLLLNLNTL